MNRTQKSFGLQASEWLALAKVVKWRGLESLSELIRLYVLRGVKADLKRMEQEKDK